MKIEVTFSAESISIKPGTKIFSFAQSGKRDQWEVG
jgi:hypothetical protein